MMESRSFTALNEGTDYDIHGTDDNDNMAQHPIHNQDNVHLVVSLVGGPPPNPQQGGVAPMPGGATDQYGYYSYSHATSSYGAHHPYASAHPHAGQVYSENANEDDIDTDEPNDGEYDLEASDDEKDQPFIDPERLTQPLKLFVGQVPKTLTEEDLAFIFEPYGSILDLTVIRDRRTGSHRGCAFVTYKRGEDAMKVVTEMHGKFKFEGATWPAQVRPAAGEIDEAQAGGDSRGEADGMTENTLLGSVRFKCYL